MFYGGQVRLRKAPVFLNAYRYDCKCTTKIIRIKLKHNFFIIIFLLHLLSN